jgi:hypothetical protein
MFCVKFSYLPMNRCLATWPQDVDQDDRDDGSKYG